MDWHARLALSAGAVLGACVYGKNWPKKCAELVQRGVDIFLMPNLVYILDGKSV